MKDRFMASIVLRGTIASSAQAGHLSNPSSAETWLVGFEVWFRTSDRQFLCEVRACNLLQMLSLPLACSHL